MKKEKISWSDFEKLDLRVGKILQAEPFPGARKPAYRLHIDFGPEIGTLKSSAQLTDRYDHADLPGTLVVAVTNFPPKQIGKFMSECLVLGALDPEGKVSLLRPDLPTVPGMIVA